VNVPPVYRGQAASPPGKTSTESLGNEKWWSVFHDPVLQQLIRTALQQNYDVQIAATRVLQAQALLRITRANQFPTLTAGASIFNTYTPKISSLISGENTAAKPKPRAPTCWAASGDAAP
jgi:multidrug efflux system outer membrane protein